MYYIIETQENADGTAAILTFQENDRNAALSKWHDVLHYAAISTVFKHSCAVLDSSLKIVAREEYTHIPPEQEPEPEMDDEDSEVPA